MPQIHLQGTALRTWAANVNFELFNASPTDLALAFQQYVDVGSRMRQLDINDITVYANPAIDFEGKESSQVFKIEELEIAQTVEGLMAAGSKFLDSVFYLMIEPAKRPLVSVHTPGTAKPTTRWWSVFNDNIRIAKCMFVYYFFIMTRARAIYKAGNATREPMPKFISSVLGINETEMQLADYIASFSLHDIDPRWVRQYKSRTLSQEALSRLGLGVAGYRLTTPFKCIMPNRQIPTGRILDDGTPELMTGDVHPKFRSAFAVARSFATTVPCWDFHPATRSPDLLKHYGNINKNLGNLILEIYEDATIKRMVEQKMLFNTPTPYDLSTEYLQWTMNDIYVPTAPMFSADGRLGS